MPLQETSGAASYDAFGGGTVAKVNYIEDFFQSYLRTGTGASATVTTGLDGSTKETLVWTKSRSAATNHKLTDNVRGATKALSSNTTSAEATDSQGLTAFSATGYTIGTNTDYNNSGATYVDWQWVSQPKLFDVLTYTGTGSNTTIAHSLGSVPGSIIVKRTDTTAAWAVYHRSLANTEYLVLNSTDAKATGATWWNSTTPTSSVFSVGTDASVNASGGTYVAYLFAHDAGGFGLTGTDNVISCGSFTVSSSTGTATLGYEPQFVMIKRINSSFGTGRWYISDSMRGGLRSNVASDEALLFPNLSNVEQNTSGGPFISCFATGFTVSGASNDTYIYIAIRRGPMKVPTSGTSVFSAVSRTGTSANATVSASISPVDMVLETARDANFGTAPNAFDRLRGANRLLITSTNGAEVNTTSTPTLTGFDVQDGFKVGIDSGGYAINYSPYIFINWNFKRAPSFMDVVCYTGTYTNRTISHNLQAVPELMIIKQRSTSNAWSVYSATVGPTGVMYLNTTGAADTSAGRGAYWNSTNPTASVFSVGQDGDVNNSGDTYVNYLFATCAGVSKVFSYTGNGSSQTINCGFTGGARFVLIKRTDSTGDWYVWDTARGIVAGNDPHLSLNTTAAEVTSNDTIDTDSTGFVVNQVSATNVNVSSATYIGLAIA